MNVEWVVKKEFSQEKFQTVIVVQGSYKGYIKKIILSYDEYKQFKDILSVNLIDDAKIKILRMLKNEFKQRSSACR